MQFACTLIVSVSNVSCWKDARVVKISHDKGLPQKQRSILSLLHLYCVFEPERRYRWGVKVPEKKKCLLVGDF